MTIPSNHLAGHGDNRAHLDFYPTPEWATEALFEEEKFEGLVLEPACGDGAMMRVIERHNPCEGYDILSGTDFLLEQRKFPNVVTNPPFKIAKEFIEHAKVVADHKIALFLKLAFLEGQSRVAMFRDTSFPLARVHVFSKRVTFHPGGIEDRKRSGTMAFAWFVWDREHEGPATINWI